jgi:hypothetical protein
MASFSAVDLTINNAHDDGDNQANLSNENSFHSSAASTGKRKRNDDGIRLQTLGKKNRTTSFDADFRNDDDDDEQNLARRYEKNKLKQERLLLITNIFRLVIVLILAPILYFVF